MTDFEVVDSFHNAWRALCGIYRKNPDESTQCALNLLSKIIGEVKTKVEDSHKEKQITLEEWIAFLNEVKNEE